MAGRGTPKGGNFGEGSAGDNMNFNQFRQVTKNDTKIATGGGLHPQNQSFNQQSAFHPAISDQVAPGPGAPWFGPPGTPQTVSPGFDINHETVNFQANNPMHQMIPGGFHTNNLPSVDPRQAIAPTYFGPLVQTTNPILNASGYPIPNFNQPMPHGNLQFSQSQQTWSNPPAPMNRNYQQYPPQSQPIQYQNSSSPLIPAAVQAADNEADSGSELEEGFLHPDTGRPVRRLLDHEKVLLKHFFSLKNPMGPVPSNRKVHIWQLKLPDQVQDEWIQFVLQYQMQAEALDREQALEEYREMIIAMKNKVYDVRRSEIRGSRHGQVGRPAGSPNKPKNESPAKKGAGVTKKGTPSKKAAPTKKATQKKGTKARRQIEGKHTPILFNF